MMLRGAKTHLLIERSNWCVHLTELLDTGVGKQQEPFTMGIQVQREEI